MQLGTFPFELRISFWTSWLAVLLLLTPPPLVCIIIIWINAHALNIDSGISNNLLIFNWTTRIYFIVEGQKYLLYYWDLL
jgi:hypothetical protein